MSAINFDKALQRARGQAAKAKDGTVVIAGEEYSLAFDRNQWFYKVTDSKGEFVVNLNERTLPKAKKYLAHWLSS